MYCLISEVVSYQSLFTELKLSKKFSSSARFYLGSHFPSRALVACLGRRVNYLALGFVLPVQHWGRCGTGGVFHLCKIRSRHSRKLKFTGLIAYIMFYQICKFESLTIINDVITKSNGKIWYLTLTSIKFEPDNQEI